MKSFFKLIFRHTALTLNEYGTSGLITADHIKLTTDDRECIPSLKFAAPLERQAKALLSGLFGSSACIKKCPNDRESLQRLCPRTNDRSKFRWQVEDLSDDATGLAVKSAERDLCFWDLLMNSFE